MMINARIELVQLREEATQYELMGFKLTTRAKLESVKKFFKFFFMNDRPKGDF